VTTLATRTAIAPPPPPLGSRLQPPLRTFEPVSRPRLLQRLDSAPAGSVIVLTAPAGYGKSTLLGQFAARVRCPVAWLSLDDRDDDPVALLLDIAHAVARAVPGAADLVGQLDAGGAGVVPHALPVLATRLGELSEPLVIVLDDLHRVCSSDALQIVHALCEHPAVTLALAGRTTPRLPLARLRAEGRLWELTAADLRMTVGEGTAMLRAAGAEVDDDQAAHVVRRTEGWAAAVYLAALMLRGQPASRRDAPRLGADDPSFTAYVRDEVLARASRDDAAFLTCTSVLDELRPDVCDSVLQRNDSDARLRALADAGLFVTRVEPRRNVYRVHALFREMLHAELRADPARELELHRRACDAYSRDGAWEQAIRHAVAAGDPGRAADLIWRLTPGYVSHGRSTTVNRWLSWLGEAAMTDHPQAALARGWAAFEEGDAGTAQHCAAVALSGDPRRRLTGGESVHALGLVLRAAVAMHGLERALEDAAQAAASLGPDDPTRGIAVLILGCGAMLHGDTERARVLLGEAEQQAAGRMTTLYGLALAHEALLSIEAERWDEADALMQRAWTFQHTLPIRDYTSQAIVSAVRALTLAHGHEIVQAREEADRAARNLAVHAVVPWLALETRVVLARARVALGDAGSARTLLDESRGADDDAAAPLLRAWATEAAAATERLATGSGDGVALTTAELRTLQYLPTHLSFAEIGTRLLVTRNTVKTHAIAIYRKLGVGSRAEAVDRARELGLVGD
jgi:LuxR family maltose regulon positive regulatory protein